MVSTFFKPQTRDNVITSKELPFDFFRNIKYFLSITAGTLCDSLDAYGEILVFISLPLRFDNKVLESLEGLLGSVLSWCIGNSEINRAKQHWSNLLHPSPKPN